MSVNFVLYVTCKEISEGSLKTLQLKLFLASTHHTPPSSSQPRQLPLAYCSQQNATQDLFYASRPRSSPKQAYLFNLAYVCFLGRGFCSSDMNFQQSESQQKYCQRSLASPGITSVACAVFVLGHHLSFFNIF